MEEFIRRLGPVAARGGNGRVRSRHCSYFWSPARMTAIVPARAAPPWFNNTRSVSRGEWGSNRARDSQGTASRNRPERSDGAEGDRTPDPLLVQPNEKVPGFYKLLNLRPVLGIGVEGTELTTLEHGVPGRTRPMTTAAALSTPASDEGRARSGYCERARAVSHSRITEALRVSPTERSRWQGGTGPRSQKEFGAMLAAGGNSREEIRGA